MCFSIPLAYYSKIFLAVFIRVHLSVLFLSLQVLCIRDGGCHRLHTQTWIRASVWEFKYIYGAIYGAFYVSTCILV